MTKSKLDKRFVHHKWFKEGVSVKHALDYFAKSGDFYLGKRKSRKQSEKLFDPINYNEVIKCSDYREKSTYKVNEVEKQYFLERVEYWKKRKEEEQQQWLNSKINVDKELKIYLAGNSNYDLNLVERQLHYWSSKDNELDTVSYWEKELHRRQQTKHIIDTMIDKYKENIRTNKDFASFKKQVDEELGKIQYWDKDKADYMLYDKAS